METEDLMEMKKLFDLLDWHAKQAGVRLLKVPRSLGDGFRDVIVQSDDTFYGIDPAFDRRALRSVESAIDARHQGYLSEDFPDAFFERARRIALDKQQLSKRSGFEFYNGKLARLKSVSTRLGKSSSEQVLELKIGYTSYFTALATNIHYGGYQYRYMNIPPEPSLSEELRWPSYQNWNAALADSNLANQVAVHLFLYNDWEILYVRRGQVGQAPNVWNSTVNGAMEFGEDNPDLSDGTPSIGATAKRECKYELNLDINPGEVRWIGVGVTLAQCEPFVVGVCRVAKQLKQIEREVLTAYEQREMGERKTRTFRKKEIRAISMRHTLQKEDFGLGPWTISIPLNLRFPANPKSLVRDKIIKQQEKTLFHRSAAWSDSGAASLLLCLAHLLGTEVIYRILSEIRKEH